MNHGIEELGRKRKMPRISSACMDYAAVRSRRIRVIDPAKSGNRNIGDHGEGVQRACCVTTGPPVS